MCVRNGKVTSIGIEAQTSGDGGSHGEVKVGLKYSTSVNDLML